VRALVKLFLGRRIGRRRLVCVKSWRPSITRDGLAWPALLVDEGGERSTVWPLWRFEGQTL
jgi:hypothetical protein